FHAGGAVEFNAPFGELNWKGRRMRPLLFAALDRLIRNEPRVAAATFVPSPRVRPAGDVALVLIRNAEREAVDVDFAADGEMENVFVTIVHESFRADRLEVTERAIIDRDRFDPMDGVLKDKNVAQLKNNFVRQHRV